MTLKKIFITRFTESQGLSLNGELVDLILTGDEKRPRVIH